MGILDSSKRYQCTNCNNTTFVEEEAYVYDKTAGGTITRTLVGTAVKCLKCNHHHLQDRIEFFKDAKIK